MLQDTDFQSVCSAEFCSAETALQEQRGESPLGAQASGPCSIRLGGEV